MVQSGGREGVTCVQGTGKRRNYLFGGFGVRNKYVKETDLTTRRRRDRVREEVEQVKKGRKSKVESVETNL